ncbi:glycosyltransferase [Vibrio rhodolitus]|uniref:glycosyltransferase n=1 Tax=Vibrio rhodolitus TaxID=2231649 RepID=UPI000E0BD07D|nr:glycosyltransferase [Vibrio rhodolitus]
MQQNNQILHDASSSSHFDEFGANQQAKHKKLTIHVVQHLAPGGIESLVLEMLEKATDDQPSMVISLEGQRLPALQHWDRLSKYSHQLLFLNKAQGVTPGLVSQLKRLFSILKPAVVHTHHIGPLLYAGSAARLAKVDTIIHTEHDGWHLDNNKRANIQNIALNLVKPRLVADADFVAKQLVSRFDYADLTVIKNGIDCQRFKPASKTLARQILKLPADATLIGCAGRLEFVKGQDVLINALAALNDNIHLAFAGVGSQLTELQELAHNLGVEKRVHWLGLVEDMPRFYQSLDLFCLPSRNEGFPLSTLEAQACNVTTIATDVGATSETLCPHSSLLVPAENPQALANAIHTLTSLPNYPQPRQFVLTHNELDCMITRYRQLAEKGE